jgi:hypothetical protein
MKIKKNKEEKLKKKEDLELLGLHKKTLNNPRTQSFTT